MNLWERIKNFKTKLKHKTCQKDTSLLALNGLENLETSEPKKEEMKPLDLSSFDEEAPMLPQDSEDEEMYDLQKELEAKFDELFGPLDDN